MSLERNDFLMRIIIEDPQLEVVRTSDEPLFTCNEPNTSYRYLGNFERLDQSARIVVVEVHRSIIETGKQPWFSRVEIDRLDTI